MHTNRIWLSFGTIVAMVASPFLIAPLGLALAQKTEPRWADIVPEGAKVEKVSGDRRFEFTEGPIWLREGFLIFSDIPANTVYAFREKHSDGAFTPFIKPSHNANGHTLDRQGRLISCEHGSRSVTRREKDGKMTTLATHYQGKRLNSPNDAVVRANGDIYFTDPPYGIEPSQAELDFAGVYRLTPKGEVILLVKDFDRPNGIALSPDEKRLYVNDTVRGHIRVFDIQPDGSLANGRVFADLKGDKPGVPDGMRVDIAGNVYSTASGGVQVFAPSGKKLGVIPTPEVAANCGWGEPDGKTLYITATHGLYRIRLKVPGYRPGLR